MSTAPVVQVQGLGKKFKIYRQPLDRLREWLTFGTQPRHREFWAVRDISFELQRGEALGLIGQNGAGKSTLLKLLTGTLYPSEGHFQIGGRVLSMLELGTGFNPELVGRQNVLNSAHLLGFPDEYIAERLDDIEAFADIGEFFERPLRMYSSGMRARLAFSMFAFLDCDVMIIDEVLSVGDTFFTQKCYERLDQLQSKGTAMIMVTHNMSVIQQYCQRAMLLEAGTVSFAGSPAETATRYFLLQSTAQMPRRAARGTGDAVALAEPVVRPAEPQAVRYASSTMLTTTALAPEPIVWPQPSAMLAVNELVAVGHGWARCSALALCDDDRKPCIFFRAGQQAHWFYEFEALEDLDAPSGVLTLHNDRNIRVHGKNTRHLGVWPTGALYRGARIRIHQTITLNLAPGEYTFGVGLTAQGDTGGFLACHIVSAGSFQITPPTGAHLGLCDLPGACEVEL